MPLSPDITLKELQILECARRIASGAECSQERAFLVANCPDKMDELIRHFIEGREGTPAALKLLRTP
jgi:hypothetical protein